MKTVAVNIDLFAVFTFLGIVQGLFLSFFFLNRNNRKVQSNKFLGLLILTLSVISTDSLLCYTNYMFKLIHFNDSTEMLNFVFPPLAYLYFYSRLYKDPPTKYLLHFIPSIIYFICCSPYYFGPIEEKYNAYISAYHPNMEHLNVSITFPKIMLVKNWVIELMIVQWNIYILFSIYQLYKYKNTESPNRNLLKFMIRDIVIFLISIIVFEMVRISYYGDLGDHLNSAMLTIIIYLISFNVVKNSSFFKAEQVSKYQKSSLDTDTKERILARLEKIMKTENYFLDSSCSLPGLAGKLGVSSNNLSQVINECLNMTFFDLLGKYRVDKAKSFLLNENRTIEDIAYSVGYNSKASFNKAFKKFTDLTPSEYRKINTQ